MVFLGEFNFFKEFQYKDKEKENYNGYIMILVVLVDKLQFIFWIFLNGKVRIGLVEFGNGFILLCLFWFVFVLVLEGRFYGICFVVQWIFIVFLLFVCLVCVFYWVEFLIYKYCKSQFFYVVFFVCLLGEFCI